jgi:hypothetical protein
MQAASQQIINSHAQALGLHALGLHALGLHALGLHTPGLYLSWGIRRSILTLFAVTFVKIGLKAMIVMLK